MRLVDPSKARNGSGGGAPGYSRVHTEVKVQANPGTKVVKKVKVTESLAEKVAEKAAEKVVNQDPNLQTIRIPSFLSPYLKGGKTLPRQGKGALAFAFGNLKEDDVFRLYLEAVEDKLPSIVRSLLPRSWDEAQTVEHYHGDLFAEVGRYTARVLSVIQDNHYDMIHAHDWMTFPAAVALKAITGLPLMLHVHSLEYDRCGGNGNWQIEQIEKAGLDAADMIAAVSYYTRSLIHQRHQIPLEKIGVVHNGVYTREMVNTYRKEIPHPSKIVLFLGRVTFQKGPDYFVEAAARVIPHVPDVLFVMAGSGDMLPRMVERVNELGISSNFLFTGFLKGPEVEKMFSMADLYVMPSVSEPFGISALEAISFNTPVIISRQSGVSEVLSHALKVNFWDIEQLANLIVSVLKYSELAQDMNSMASEEVRRLRWDAAAVKTVELYGKTLGRQ